jgi:sugar phosphate isomerase/epimerase
MSDVARDASGTLGLERLALNGATVQRWGAVEAIEGCARHDIAHIGLWREKVAADGLDRVRRALEATGVRVASLCRGGFFPAGDEAARRARLDDNRRALDEAAALGTRLLVLVCGGVVGRDLEGSRAMVEAGIAALAPQAEARGVQLGIEPLHPMFAAERSVVCTLDQALAIATRVDSPAVGVVVDAYHVWWDEGVHDAVARAGAGSGTAGRGTAGRRTPGRPAASSASAARGTPESGGAGTATAGILGFHVSDWIVPLPDPLLGRGVMGDGVIDLRALRAGVDAAGYRGPIEVEIFNQRVWDAPGDDVLRLLRARFAEHVLG